MNNNNKLNDMETTRKPLLKDQLCFRLYALSRKVIGCYSADFERLGITYLQYLIFLLFNEKPEWTVKEMGKKLYLDSGTLTPTLKRMQEKGWVDRNRSTEDERIVNVNLTTKGKKLSNELTEVPETLKQSLNMSNKAIQPLKAELDHLLHQLNNTVN